MKVRTSKSKGADLKKNPQLLKLCVHGWWGNVLQCFLSFMVICVWGLQKGLICVFPRSLTMAVIPHRPLAFPAFRKQHL